MEARKIQLPLTDEVIRSLKAGDSVLLSGDIITGRDAAHKRLVTCLEKGEPMPVTVKGQTIYYVGPCPKKPGMEIGSCGPTSSYRCDPFTPTMLDQGLKGMIGKGLRAQETIEAMKKHCAVYFSGIGGAGAFYANCVKKAEVIAYEDLGPEAIYHLVIEDLPVIVAIDCYGNSIYEHDKKD